MRVAWGDGGLAMIFHDRPEIAEHLSSINGVHFLAVISAKDAAILVYFSRSDSGMDIVPEIVDP